MKAITFVLLITVGLGMEAKAQKGERNLSAGPFISFPTGAYSSQEFLKPGVGVEGVGQYHFSNKSALLLQTSWASYNEKNSYTPEKRLAIFTVGGGYQYYFSPGGMFANLLAVLDKNSNSPLWSHALRLGTGKRFLLKNDRFLVAGVDYVFGDTYSRINLKALITLFQ